MDKLLQHLITDKEFLARYEYIRTIEHFLAASKRFSTVQAADAVRFVQDNIDIYAKSNLTLSASPRMLVNVKGISLLLSINVKKATAAQQLLLTADELNATIAGKMFILYEGGEEYLQLLNNNFSMINYKDL